jgi:hypothetical protein
MEIKSTMQAATLLLSLVNHRQKAYEAAHQQQKISSTHPAFAWCRTLKPALNRVANGETQKWNIHEVCKQIAGLHFIAKKKKGEVVPNQKNLIDTCITYLREQAYTLNKVA